MKKKNGPMRSLNFEGLEDRNLLSADFGLQLADSTAVGDAAAAPAICAPVVSCETTGESTNGIDAPVVNTLPSELENLAAESSLEESLQPVVLQQDQVSSGQLPGFFGVLDSENPSQSFQYEAPESGTVQLAIAGDFENPVAVEVLDQDGNLVTRSNSSSLKGIMELEFSAEDGDGFEIRIAAEEPANESFMVTVGFEADPVPMDLHADQIGDSSTQLNLDCGACEVEGEVGRDGDVDTFQFQPPADGKIGINVSSGESNEAVSIKVIDGAGNLVARGRAGESIDFEPEVQADQLYYVVVESMSENPATYQLNVAVPQEAIASPGEAAPELLVMNNDQQFQVESTVLPTAGFNSYSLEAPESGMLGLNLEVNDITGTLTVKNEQDQILAEGLGSQSLQINVPVEIGERLTFEVRSPGGESLDFRLEGELNGNSEKQERRSGRSSLARFAATERQVLDSLFADSEFSRSFRV